MSGGAWPMYRSMVGTGILCGLLIVTVFLVTGPTIERNKAEALQRAIFLVLPQASSSTTFRMDEDGRFAVLDGEAKRGSLVHAGYDDSRQLVGLAVEAHGMGYQDVIRVIYGYSFTKHAVVGVRVLESKETPGLGDRIETDPDFLRNFESLDVSLSPDRSTVLHPIEAVRHGTKTRAWEVDGITGATISSEAIATILRRSTEFWVPRIQRGLDDFRGEERDAG